VQRVLPWIVSLVAVAIAIGAFVVSPPWRGTQQLPALRVSADLGAAASLVTAQGAAAILSPDGMTIAFVGQTNTPVGASQQVYVRRLDQLAALPLAGTEAAMNPFFSPDGRWIGFFADGKLKKVAVTGGSAFTLADAPNGRGGSWSEDDTIVFAPNVIGGLWRVSATGGNATQVTAPVDVEVTHRWPQWLPDGKGFLYTSNTGVIGYEGSSLIVQSIAPGARRMVLKGGYHGRYLPSGHLVYMHEGSLFATPFALDSLDATGTPVPILEGVASGAVFTAGAQFAAAGNGTLLYVPSDGDAVPIHWLDESGNAAFLRESRANWNDPSFAPDGRRLAMHIYNGSQSDIWVYDWTRDALSRVTFDPSSELRSAWTPNGQRIVFGSTRGGGGIYNLYWQRVDGTGDVERLTEAKTNQWPSSFHPSGRFLAHLELGANFDVVILPLDGNETSGWKPSKPISFLNGPAAELEPVFSPDGRWLAYASNESGQFEVYVRPFPGPGGKWQISTGGGSFPTWSHAKQELFYATLDQRIMVAPYTVEGGSFRSDRPRLWADRRHSLRGPIANRSFDLHPDGKRFALAAVPESDTAQADKVVLIFNFFEELRRAVPTK
jgi:serine/threonine-protein kinase